MLLWASLSVEALKIVHKHNLQKMKAIRHSLEGISNCINMRRGRRKRRGIRLSRRRRGMRRKRGIRLRRRGMRLRRKGRWGDIKNHTWVGVHNKLFWHNNEVLIRIEGAKWPLTRKEVGESFRPKDLVCNMSCLSIWFYSHDCEIYVMKFVDRWDGRTYPSTELQRGHIPNIRKRPLLHLFIDENNKERDSILKVIPRR
ncbi:hypothetical protein RHMOL_Rhmol05G0078100 [Rhododendron molle]|uniref:Uncharacterized protein n=1 Tax=Rhododendron molle TaxID=49168 RepID=A0ACC0NLP0_RHOML|nr:hypothetical protein RHMOL_Rhmol05G0078100 [Rhododendron molle]